MKKCQCSDCTNTVAEWMLETASRIIGGTSQERNTIYIFEAAPSDDAFAMVAVAIKLSRSPKSLILRAIVEEWSQSKIVKELY